MRFQGMAVVLAKQRWPELVQASERTTWGSGFAQADQKHNKALKLLGAKAADYDGEPLNHFFSSRPQLLLSASFIYIYRTRSRGPAARC